MRYEVNNHLHAKDVYLALKLVPLVGASFVAKMLGVNIRTIQYITNKRVKSSIKNKDDVLIKLVPDMKERLIKHLEESEND